MSPPSSPGCTTDRSIARLQRFRAGKLGCWIFVPLVYTFSNARDAFVRDRHVVSGWYHERLRGLLLPFLVSFVSSMCRPRSSCLTSHRRSNVDIGSPISPSRYSRDPFLERADLDSRYGDRRRERSVSYLASSRSGHGLPRRHSSYGIPPMMNPSVAFSDPLDAPWRVGRKRALCVRTSTLPIPSVFELEPGTDRSGLLRRSPIRAPRLRGQRAGSPAFPPSCVPSCFYPPLGVATYRDATRLSCRSRI